MMNKQAVAVAPSASGRGGAFVIADPSLRDERGHHFRLAKIISDALLEEGFSVLWFTHREFDVKAIPKGIALRPVFSVSMYDKYMQRKAVTKGQNIKEVIIAQADAWLRRQSWVRYMARMKPILQKRGIWPQWAEPGRQAYNTLTEELILAIQDNSLTSADHVLFHTADGLVYKALLDMVSVCSMEKMPSIHVSTPYDIDVMPNKPSDYSIDRIIFYLSVLGVIGKKIFLYAENELLAEYLAGLWGQSVKALNLPAECGELVDRKPAKERAIEIVYLGAARVEKGFMHLPSIVQSLWEVNGKTGRIHFNIQCSPQIVGYAPGIEDAIERMGRYPRSYVKLVPHSLSQEKYERMLSDADVVMMCYDREKYRVRGSGIAVEAVSRGKIVLGTPGTFPAFLSGKAAATGGNAEELATALSDIINNLDRYRSDAARIAEKYRYDNSPSRYVQHMLENVIYVDNSSSEEISDSENTGPNDKDCSLAEKNDDVSGRNGSAMAVLTRLKSSGAGDMATSIPVRAIMQNQRGDSPGGMAEDCRSGPIRFGRSLDRLVDNLREANNSDSRVDEHERVN